MAGVEISEEQALAFRARRHHLWGPGAAGPAAAARAVVGIQAQQLPPALWALSMRTAGRPTAAGLATALTTAPDLVRTWGQRDTVHIYDAATHWAPVVVGLRSWPAGARGTVLPEPAALEAARVRIEGLGRPVTRADLFDLVPEAYLAYMRTRTGPGMPALRAAAGRFIWDLSRQGLLSAHDTVGGEQAYVLRRDRYPGLAWTEPDDQAAAVLLARDWLAANAPATVQDLAHFLGTRVGQARAGLAGLEGELVAVACGGRKGLQALARDQEALTRPAPGDWPPRLLPKYDTMLMAHADKSWTVPVVGEREQVWAKAGDVRATVLHRGRVVATWRQAIARRTLQIELSPLSGWVPGLEAALAAEARDLARHLGVEQARVAVG